MSALAESSQNCDTKEAAASLGAAPPTKTQSLKPVRNERDERDAREPEFQFMASVKGPNPATPALPARFDPSAHPKTIKWPSKEGSRGRRGASLAASCGGSLARMEVAGTAHILRMPAPPGLAEAAMAADAARLPLPAPKQVARPKKRPRRFCEMHGANGGAEAPAAKKKARVRKRPLLEMAQVKGLFDGKRAFISRVLCGPKDGAAAAARPPGGEAAQASLLDAVTDLACARLPHLRRAHFEHLLQERGTACFVAHTLPDADCGEEVVLGGAAVRRAHQHLFQVSFICVEEESKGKKLGAQLLKRLLSHARKYKVPRVAAYADHSAVGFFRKHGFRDASARDLPPGLFETLDVYSESKLVVVELSFPGAEARAAALMEAPVGEGDGLAPPLPTGPAEAPAPADSDAS